MLQSRGVLVWVLLSELLLVLLSGLMWVLLSEPTWEASHAAILWPAGMGAAVGAVAGAAVGGVDGWSWRGCWRLRRCVSAALVTALGATTISVVVSLEMASAMSATAS